MAVARLQPNAPPAGTASWWSPLRAVRLHVGPFIALHERPTPESTPPADLHHLVCIRAGIDADPRPRHGGCLVNHRAAPPRQPSVGAGGSAASPPCPRGPDHLVVGRGSFSHTNLLKTACHGTDTYGVPASACVRLVWVDRRGAR